MKIDEKTFNAMPAQIQAMFTKRPNPGSEEVLEGFPKTTSKAAPRGGQGFHNCLGRPDKERKDGEKAAGHTDSGSAARFFYCAKASRSERDAGCGGMPHYTGGEITDRADGSAGLQSPRAGAGRTSGGHNTHPTVKPLALMRYLCRLITPPGGIVLDMFLGSGTTAMAAKAEGFRFVGIEKEAEHAETAKNRITSIHAPRTIEGKPNPNAGTGPHTFF